MNTWKQGQPCNFEQLFQFYHDYVKLLYSGVQTQNTMPVEMLFEINAALDHISTHWAYGTPEDEVVASAFSHLKRSCLDVFKLRLRETREQYDLLRRIDTSAVDNGEFDRKLHPLFNEIKKLATQARRMEGAPDNDNSIPAFDLWEEVYAKCIVLEQDYYEHPKLDWARKRSVGTFVRQNAWGFIIGIVSSLIATWMWDWVVYYITRFLNL